MSVTRRWNILAGEFFFRYRNALFPTLFVVLTLIVRPKVFLNHRTADRCLVIFGVLIALLGEFFRLMTIGYEYIDRGGKNGHVHASRLVTAGVYAHTRNPMYVGNMLIAIGVCMASGAPLAYLVALPAFLFIYQSIVVTEEEYLRQKFGVEYVEYCAKVPRFVPSFRGMKRSLFGVPYHWKRALRQDLSTLTALLAALTLLPLWRIFFLEGFDAAKRTAPRAIGMAVVILVLYTFLVYLKKQKYLQ